MARPRAIYGSVPPDSKNGADWKRGPEVSVPVLYDKPRDVWVEFNWLGDMADDNSPTEYGREIPQHLWSDPVVKHPESGETRTFTRRWTVAGADFTGAKMPEGEYAIVISHAADDQYEMQLAVNGVIRNPIGGNSYLPVKNSWRNATMYVYRLILTEEDIITLTSIVTNDPQQGASPRANPAMFIWIMQVFDHPIPF